MIGTRNNARGLAATLAALARCEIPAGLRWEILVVDNGSTDDTRAVAAAAAGPLPLRVLSEPVPGVSRARNAGLRAAAGALAIITDDDVSPNPRWLAAYCDAHRRLPTGHYFGGPIESRFEGAPPAAALLAVAPYSVRGLDWGDQEGLLPPGAIFLGANWACPRDALLEAGGFDESLGLGAGGGGVRTGEESAVMARLDARGWRPWYLPRARLVHTVPAAKCTLAHIAARTEANTYAEALRTGETGRPARTLGAVPLYLWRRAGRRYVAWMRARLGGGPAVEEYVAWRATLGRVRAHRSARRRARVTGG